MSRTLAAATPTNTRAIQSNKAREKTPQIKVQKIQIWTQTATASAVRTNLL